MVLLFFGIHVESVLSSLFQLSDILIVFLSSPCVMIIEMVVCHTQVCVPTFVK